MRRTFVYKLKPTRGQAVGFQRYLDVTREVYNAALEQRIEAYKRCGITRNWMAQSKEVKELRKAGLLEDCHVHPVKFSLARLEFAYQRFFAGLKPGGERKGFPKFKGARHWRSIRFQEYGRGCELRGNRLFVSSVGKVRVRRHRPLEGTPKFATIIRRADGWYVDIVCDMGDAPPLRGGGRTIGIDLGLENFATLSDGEVIPTPDFFESEFKAIGKEYSRLARTEWGSKRSGKRYRKMMQSYLKRHRKRKDFHFKIARDLVSRFDRIAIEDLKVVEMHKTGIRHINRGLTNAAFAQFSIILEQKCEQEGVEFVRVDPRNTSQECSRCKELVVKSLAQRKHSCECGLVLHRDHNAAINIMNRAWAESDVEARVAPLKREAA